MHKYLQGDAKMETKDGDRLFFMTPNGRKDGMGTT